MGTESGNGARVTQAGANQDNVQIQLAGVTRARMTRAGVTQAGVTQRAGALRDLFEDGLGGVSGLLGEILEEA